MSEAASSSHVMEHWEALKKYDERRRRSMAEPTTIIHDDDEEHQNPQLSRAGEYHRESSYHDGHRRRPTDRQGSAMEDYLPPMPAEAPQSRAPPPGPAIRPPASYNPSVQDEAPMQMPASRHSLQYQPQPVPGAFDDDTLEDEFRNIEILRQEREQTPPALNGQNGVLVDREMQRLREERPLERRRKWRILAGTSSLPIFAFTLYIAIKSIVAFMELSPAKWVFSEAKNGTAASPDTGLRSFALAEFVMSIISILGILTCGVYLRATRRRTVGRRMIWIPAILSAGLQVMLSLVNLALVVQWHKMYAQADQDPLAHTRDVGQRCAGSWDMDIVWAAAKSSVVAKPEGHAPACSHDPAGTVKAYLVAGGIRLCLFAVFSTIWLAALGRYNRTIRLDMSRTETLEESPEMLNLLQQDGELPIVSPYYATPRERSTAGEGYAPRLSRFDWQRDASVARSADDRDNVRVYGNISKSHAREESAGQWSMSVLGRLKSAIRGEGSQEQAYDNLATVAEDDENIADRAYASQSSPARYVLPERRKSQLGVGGWFRRVKDALGGDASDEDEDFDTVQTDLAEKHAHGWQRHERTASQERRQVEGRHAAVRHAYGQGDVRSSPATAVPIKKISLRERSEARRQDSQKRRQAKLRGLTPSRGSTDASQKETSRDALQVMPTMRDVPQPQWSDDYNDAIYWQDGDDLGLEAAAGHFRHQAQLLQAQEAPVYVRTLGRLVRRMSLIESVGSDDRRSRSRSKNRSASMDR